MSEQPLVSVVLPTHNRAQLLLRALSSVLSQSYTNMEVIVVDDASSDDTDVVVARLNDARVRYHRMAEQVGAAAARNTGIDMANGELVAFQDSDDLWLPAKMERQVAALMAAEQSVGICVCSLEVVQFGRTDVVRWESGVVAGEEAVARIAGGAGYATPSLLVRRSVLRSVGGFDADLPRLQDYELTLRIAQKYDFLMMPDVLLRNEITSDSLSVSPDRYADAIEKIIDRHAETFRKHARGHSHMIFRAGKFLALDGRQRRAITYFRRAWRIDPANVRAAAGLLMAALGLFTLLRKTRYRYIGPN